MRKKEYTIDEQELLTFKKRRYARSAVTKALREGLLVRPSCCSLCKRERKAIHAHHIDYGKPLEVLWLCTACHGIAHRKRNLLNPCNNEQSPMPQAFACKELIPVTIFIPVSNFLALNEASQQAGLSVSKMLKKQVINHYSTRSTQLELNFGKKYDNSQNAQQRRISRMETNERGMPKPQRAILQNVRGKRNLNMSGMEGEFFSFLQGHGVNAERLQRTGTD